MPEDYRLARAREILAELADSRSTAPTVPGLAAQNGKAMYALEALLSYVADREFAQELADTKLKLDQLLKIAEANTRRIVKLADQVAG